MRIFERWYILVCVETWDLVYRVIIVSWRILVSFWGFFKDYILTWWSIWVSITLLLPEDKFWCKWQVHCVPIKFSMRYHRVLNAFLACCSNSQCVSQDVPNSTTLYEITFCLKLNFHNGYMTWTKGL